MAADKTSIVHAQQQLERLAHSDSLTQLANRFFMHHAIAQEMRAQRHGALLLIDLDYFKSINDSLGHSVGDAVLQQVLARIRGVLRPDDVVARLEADSFVVVTECDRKDCEQLAYRLSDVVGKRPLRIDGQAITVTVSIGVAMSHPGDSVAMLLARAERALLSARIAGHGAVGHEPMRATASTAME